jgi:O-acetyl-ADP-ribose deacetylase (regulator of RNase III)
MASSFELAVRVFNEPLPATAVTVATLPPPLAAHLAAQPPCGDAALFLTSGADPSVLWAAQENGSVSAELKAINGQDFEALQRDRAHAQSRERASSFERTFPVSDTVNRCVRVCDDFWLSHRHVNAVTVSANEALQGGGGQDKVVHFLAGESLKAETATFPDDGGVYYGGFRVRCPTGEVRISHGHNLHQPYIIHLVGPYLDEAGQVQVRLYIQTLRNVLACIDGDRIRTVSLAVFGTGYYGCPHLLACIMTLRVLREWLEVPGNASKCDEIIVCPHYGGASLYRLLWPLVFPS